MYVDFSNLFHRSSKDRAGGGTVDIPWDESIWPTEWNTIYYKTYPRFKKLPLPETNFSADFFDLIRRRSTNRNFSRTALTPERLSALLKYSCGITHDTPDQNPRRAQPSGGGRYPIEAYPVIFNDVEGIPAGVYHYNVKEHALDTISARPFSREDIAQLSNYPWVQNASMLLVLTAVFWRTQAKYGERGYRYIMLEAGHVGQNVYLASKALDIKCTGLGGTNDERLESLIRVDGIDESLVYALAIG